MGPVVCCTGAFFFVLCMGAFLWYGCLRDKESNSTSVDVSKFLVVEFFDLVLDVISWTFTNAEGDFDFGNDPGHLIRSMMFGVCALSIVGWVAEFVAYCVLRERFYPWCRCLNMLHVLFEDGLQSVLYTSVAVSQATGGTGIAWGLILGFIQSLCFFLYQLGSLWDDPLPAVQEVAPNATTTTTATTATTTATTVTSNSIPAGATRPHRQRTPMDRVLERLPVQAVPNYQELRMETIRASRSSIASSCASPEASEASPVSRAWPTSPERPSRASDAVELSGVNIEPSGFSSRRRSVSHSADL